MSAHRDLLDSTLTGFPKGLDSCSWRPSPSRWGPCRVHHIRNSKGFDHSSVVNPWHLKTPWFVFFLVWIHFFAKSSWKKWWGVGMIGRDRPICWFQAVQNFEVDFDCTRICEKTLNGQDPKCFLPPTALLSQGRFFFDVVSYPPWVKAWLHVTWINRDGICGAVLRISDCEPQIR